MAVLFCPPCNYSQRFDIEIWKYSERSVCNKTFLLLYVSLTLTDSLFFLREKSLSHVLLFSKRSREKEENRHTVLHKQAHINATLLLHCSVIKQCQRYYFICCTVFPFSMSPVGTLLSASDLLFSSPFRLLSVQQVLLQPPET